MKLEFSANLEGLAFPDGEELHVPVATEFGTLSAVMSTPERGALSIVVSIDAVCDTADAAIAERCLQIVSALVDRLAVLCDVGLGSVEEKPTDTRQIPPSRPTSTTVVHDGDLVIVGARNTLRAEVGPLTRAGLRRVLVFGAGRRKEGARQPTEPLPGDPLFHSICREVLRGRDVLVRFVMLYAVLDAIVGADGARGKCANPNFVFVFEFGTYINTWYIYPFVKVFCKRAGIEYDGLHVFRRTSGSLLILEGRDAKAVSRRLGHTDVAFTLRTYQHVFDEQHDAAVLSFDVVPAPQPAGAPN